MSLGRNGIQEYAWIPNYNIDHELGSSRILPMGEILPSAFKEHS